MRGLPSTSARDRDGLDIEAEAGYKERPLWASTKPTVFVCARLVGALLQLGYEVLAYLVR